MSRYRWVAWVALMSSVSGCGIVDLWYRTAPVDTAGEVTEDRCQLGVAAFCGCRELTTGQECLPEEIEAWRDRCVAGDDELVSFLACVRAERQANGQVDCEAATFCGAIPNAAD